MSNYVNLVTNIPTTATFVLVGGLVLVGNEMPIIPFESFPQSYQIQDLAGFGSSHTQYKITSKHVDALGKIETIRKFASNLLENIEDLDPDFSKVIDENYWDLI